MTDTLTIDPASGNAIRPTDNGLKPGDHEAPQTPKPLTDEEIENLIADILGDDNGNS